MMTYRTALLRSHLVFGARSWTNRKRRAPFKNVVTGVKSNGDKGITMRYESMMTYRTALLRSHLVFGARSWTNRKRRAPFRNVVTGVKSNVDIIN
ncbi:hypothetical protein D1864_15285 [Oceanobacillus picturae]|nr:hypothetical protein D1864_15285 [Oceanobacillus picturae]